MRSLTVRLLLSFFALITVPAMAHDVTITGTNTFASLDGSSSDHDGAANGVFTVSDGNLAVNGVVNCNDDSGANDSACAMAFAVSGNMSVNAGGALYAENRSGSGSGGAITLTVGGNLALNGNAVVSSASKSSTGATGGAIKANVNGSVTIASGSTIDSGSANARGGAIAIAAAGLVTVDGNVLSGPSRTILSTRLSGGAALDGGTANTIGGAITIGSSSFAEPAVVVGATANIVSQGGDGGAGPVSLDGCGITIRGLVAALSRKDGAAKVSIRSGKDVLIDGRDLGATGIRMGRVRADAPTGTALNKGVDIFATETIDIHGPASGFYAVTSLPGLHDTKSYGGLIRITSIGDAVNGSGNMIDDGHTASGDSGGTVEIAAREDVTLNTAVIRAVGDFNTNNPNRGGGAIRIRSFSGDVFWTNGLGEVRPVGSTSNLPLADQGSIVLTACGTVNTTGSTFPVMGTATSVFPETQTGVCSPAAPSLPAGVPPLITCNTPPVANDTSASTNEDTTVTITLSGSDADGDPLTFSIVSGPSKGTLGAIVPTGPTTATVNYSPNANYNGGDSFVFRANDGNGGTDDATATIAVTAVNDAPSFLAGPTVSVLEDSGARSFPNWASSISAGPADESGQTVTFTVTNGNNALFAVQPAVSSNGTLTFTPAANASGSTTITIVAHDNGGTANGGVDTSAAQTSSITITAVNDEPSFTAGGNVTVSEDSGAYSAAWASAISAGPGETQNVTFIVTSDNNAFFAAQPAISSTGVLTFTPAANVNGSVNVSVTLRDDGGTANGGDDTSAAQPFVITVTAVNDAPSFLADPSVSVIEDSGAQSFPNWASSISAGPADESGQTVTFTVTNGNNALFAVQPAVSSNGTLTFTPAANASGSTTITVVAHDNGGTANGGVDTSAAQTSSITITAVNDEPSFTAGGNVTVSEDSGAYSAAWASAISAGPGETQNVTFIVTNDNNAFFAAQPAISLTGVLTFTPAANVNGSVNVSVTLQDDGGTANGGDDTSAAQPFVITITAVNDAPSFTGGGDVSVLEDSGAYSAPWASAISAGPANESGQSVSFTVTNSNNALFAVQPAIDPAGNLTFTLAANASGPASVTVKLSDNGGTANGGADTSASQTFTINIGAVNDAPSFTSGGNVTVNEDSGAYSAPWASSISAGPNESGQVVTFVVSNGQNALFSVQPSISSAGVLTFTPAPNAFGTATVTVYAQDNGGTANGGANTSGSVTFDIIINGVNDGPAVANDTWETEGNTELRVDRGAALTPFVGDTTPSGKGVLDNDADTVEGDPVVVTGVVGCADTVAPFVCAVTGGTVTLEANGSFTFQPSAGATSASFHYTATDQPSAGAPASVTGSVTIKIHDMIWYVNGGAASGGNGTSSSPFNNFTQLNGSGDVDGAGDYVFVHTSAVNGSIALETQQKLWGQGVGLIIPRNLNGNGSPATIVPAGVRPTLSSATDTIIVTGVAGVEVAGLHLVSTLGSGIDVSSPAFAGAASASISSNSITAGLEGIDVTSFNSGTTAVHIHATDIVSAANGLDITGGTGTVIFSYNNSTITSTGGTGILADGASLDALYVTSLQGMTVTGATTGNGIELLFARFDAAPSTAAFDVVSAGFTIGTSADPVGGSGVVMSNTSGAVAFGTLIAHGSTTGVTIVGTGLSVGNLTGMRVSSVGGAISAGAGHGLAVSNATIGSTNLNLTSVSAQGAANGIVLNNTGTTGGLHVTGTGTAGSGGTIQNTTGTAIAATNAAHLGLAWMNITNPGAHGVDAQNVSGSNSVVGTIVTQFNAATANGIQWINTNVDGTLTVSGTTVSNAPTGNDGLLAEARGTSNMTIMVDQASRFSGLLGDGVQVNTITGASGNVNVTIRDSQFDTAAANGNNGIALAPFGGPTTFRFLVERNTLNDIGRPVSTVGNINVIAGDFDGGGPSVTGTVRQNVIQRGNGRRGINMIADTFTTLFDVTVTDNDIDRLTKGAVGIDLRNNASGKARVTNNRIGQLAGFVGQVGFNEEAIRVQTQNNAVLQTLIDGNIVTANANLEVVRVRAIGTSSHSTTVTNNTITDTAGSHLELAANTASAVGAGPTLCFNVSGNTLPAAGVGVININEGAGTALDVVQASTAAVSATNSGAAVTQVGTPQYGTAACALP